MGLQNFDMLVKRCAQSYLSFVPTLVEMTIWKSRKHLPNYSVASFKNGFFLLENDIHTLKGLSPVFPPLPLPSTVTTEEIKC